MKTAESDCPARRRALGKFVALLAWGCGTAFDGLAQTPAQSKSLRIVVASPPGALGDILSRLLGQPLGNAIGQPVIVDNRAGAAGAIAAAHVAKAPADGQTLMVALDSVFVINPSIYKKLPYDPARDFQAVGLICKASSVVVANPALGVKSFAEFVRLVKSKPGTITFGSAGTGHTTHIAMELMSNRLGLRMTHVPYKGSSLALQDLMGGRIDVMLLSVPETLAQMSGGKILPLAATGPAAKDVFPDLPELRAIHPDLDIAAWFALFAPAATPPDALDALNAALNSTLRQPEVAKRLRDFGLTPMPGPRSVVESLIAQDAARFDPLVKALGIQAD